MPRQAPIAGPAQPRHTHRARNNLGPIWKRTTDTPLFTTNLSGLEETAHTGTVVEGLHSPR